VVFREESIRARASQILGVEGGSKSLIKKKFCLLIAKYHPDKCGPPCTEQAKVLIEAYDILMGKAAPLDCKLLENDELVSSLLSKGDSPVKLGVKYDDWLKENFYDFLKPE
jgi:preprotein translocase subunit Sec63